MIVTFFATWMSASSIEKMEVGEAERDLELAGRGEFGQTYIDGCKKVLGAISGELSGDGSSRTSCSSGSNTYVSESKVALLFLLVAEETGRGRLTVGGARIVCSSSSKTGSV